MALPLLVGITILCYTAFGIFAGKASGRIDSSLSATVFSAVSALVAFAYWAVARSSEATTTSGMTYSVLGGVAVGAFSVGVIMVFSRGGVTYGFPLIYGGTIVLGAIAGMVLLGERPNALHLAGMAVTAVGLGMIVWANR